MRPTILDLFPCHVTPDPSGTGCWNWTGSIYPNGYGLFQTGKRNNRVNWLAHRLSWVVTNGVIADEKLVLHRCDNKRCVNPGHLWLGTQAENMKDMVDKGRAVKEGSRGRGNWSTRLDEGSVLKIRAQPDSVSHSCLAREFGVSVSTVRLIRKRQIWAWL